MSKQYTEKDSEQYTEKDSEAVIDWRHQEYWARENMVAFISDNDSFRIWMDMVKMLVTKCFKGIEFDFSLVPDHPYREWWEDGIRPEIAADCVLESIQDANCP